MSDYRRPARTPIHVNRLQQLLQSYSSATGVAPTRLQHWLTMMVMIGALDRVQADPQQPLFFVSLFTFERRLPEPIGATGSQRVDVKVFFNRRSWATVQLEISPPEGHAGRETEIVDAISIEDFRRMVLVADPSRLLWQVTVIGSFDGPAHAALLRAGEVTGASSVRVNDGAVTGPMLDATIVVKATVRRLAGQSGKAVAPA